jgi:MoaA/NifB/PqqE/SkfB family radical SAM enzyme
MPRPPLPDASLICTQPFEWCEIREDGRVFLCCPSWLKLPIGNLLQQSLEEIWNGSEARRIRTSVLDASLQYCNPRRCPRRATLTAPVQRLGEVTDPEVLAALRGRKTRLPYGPKKLNLCYDRSCNLSCSSCRSQPWAPTREARDLVDRITGRLRQQAAARVQTLIVSGSGDPFVSAAYRDLLQGINAVDFPRLQSIELHSNGLLWNQALWASLGAIHPYVQLAEISVDAASAATYAANRGGDFGCLLENLAYVATLPIGVKLSCVVQANNFRELPAFAALAAAHGFSAYCSQLVNWGTFSRGEFAERAVHLPEHPQHDEFKGVLGEIALLPHVDLGNLRSLLVEVSG